MDLKRDLTRPQETIALTYTTSSRQPLYLRLTTLGDFSGDVWRIDAAPSAGSGGLLEQLFSPRDPTEDMPRALARLVDEPRCRHRDGAQHERDLGRQHSQHQRAQSASMRSPRGSRPFPSARTTRRRQTTSRRATGAGAPTGRCSARRPSRTAARSMPSTRPTSPRSPTAAR